MVRLTLHRLFLTSSSSAALVLAACGGPAAPATSTGAPSAAGSSGVSAGMPASSTPGAAASSGSAAPATTGAGGGRKLPDAAAVYAKLESGLVHCYEVGKKATPEMTDGKLTLNASIDAAGRATCVIPSDHTGLTQDLEDCMAARLAAEKFDEGTAWTAVVPIVLRSGVLHRGEAAGDRAVIDSVETVRMPDAFEALEALEPALQACIRSADRSGGVHGLLVGARVGADGRPQCALATSTGPLPASVGECASGVLRGAKFPPPKRGSGLVLVPINVVGTK